jgi:fructosamine-3-kinase
MMNLPSAVQEYLCKHGHGSVEEVTSVGGGCINNGVRLKTSFGHTFFLKLNRSAPADMFSREAEGLKALRVEGAPAVPEAYDWGSEFILLQDLEPAPRSKAYWATFGRQLATLHSSVADQFGFAHDNYIGSTPQPNPWTEDGHAFFRRHRLIFQATLAEREGRLNGEEFRRVEKLADRLAELVPSQPASLIHGDLWSGNAITDSEGEPAIIDPAAHYGWAEAELAMTTLFGRFPEPFYSAYEAERTLHPGWRDRFPIYNLYHLLNHLNLFGSSYLTQVRSILRRYT